MTTSRLTAVAMRWALTVVLGAAAVAPLAAFGNCYCSVSTSTCTGSAAGGCDCGGTCPSGCYQPGQCQFGVAGGCEHLDLCGGGTVCTSNVCNGSFCVNQPKTCPASTNQCLACSYDGGTATCSNNAWTYVPKTGASCNDAQRCTFNDACSSAGACSGTSYLCDAGACRICPADGGCQAACQGDGGCDYSGFQPVANGTSCGTSCAPAACNSGVCVPLADAGCPAPGECQTNGCDGGACTLEPLADGTPCTGGSCAAGACVPATVNDAGPRPEDAGVDAGVGEAAPDPFSVNGCGCTSVAPGFTLALIAAATLRRRSQRLARTPSSSSGANPERDAA